MFSNTEGRRGMKACTVDWEITVKAASRSSGYVSNRKWRLSSSPVERGIVGQSLIIKVHILFMYFCPTFPFANREIIAGWVSKTQRWMNYQIQSLDTLASVRQKLEEGTILLLPPALNKRFSCITTPAPRHDEDYLLDVEIWWNSTSLTGELVLAPHCSFFSSGVHAKKQEDFGISRTKASPMKYQTHSLPFLPEKRQQPRVNSAFQYCLGRWIQDWSPLSKGIPLAICKILCLTLRHPQKNHRIVI